MNRCIPLLASLISMHAMLCGAAAMNAAYAEDAAPISNQSNEATNFSGSRGGAQGGHVTPSGLAAELGTNTTKASNAAGEAELEGAKKSTSEENASRVEIGTTITDEHHAGSRGTQREEETSRESAPRGHNSTGAKQNGTELGPIDTRITVVGAARSWRSSRDHSWKKAKVARPSGNLRYGRASARTTKGSVVRNAIGLPVPHTTAELNGRVANDISQSNQLPRNGGIQFGGADLHREGFIPLQARGAKAPDFPSNAAMNHSIIGGRDLIRQSSGAAVIGGPVKRSAGLISGTNFQTRHP
jgi:hypothetical protein